MIKYFLTTNNYFMWVKTLQKIRMNIKGSIAKALVLFFIIQPFNVAFAAPTADSAVGEAVQSTKVEPNTASEKVQLAAPKKASPDAAKDKTAVTPSISEMGVMGQMVVDDGADGSNSGLLNPSTINKMLPTADAATGALAYDYPIVVPPGRNGMQPELKLFYNSQRTEADSPFGAGWSISIPFIERQNVSGSDKIYSSQYFISSLDGELKQISGGDWGVKSETGSFNAYSFSNGRWTVVGKNGLVYKFGHSTSGQIVDPNNATRIYRWWLEEVRDSNDNYIKYQYFKDGNQSYPSSITYTGNGTTDGVLGVSFLRESRSDSTKFFKAGFPVTTAYRINEIDITINSVLSRKLAISYQVGDNGHKSLVSGVVETGYDEAASPTVLPATAFEYQSSIDGFTQDTNWDIPSVSAYNGSAFSHWSGTNDFGTRFADVNGDGLIDILHARYINGPTREESVWINNGHGWTQDTSWDIPSVSQYTGSAFVIDPGKDLGVRLADVNGDGRVDIVQSMLQSYAPRIVEKGVWINNGSGWTKDENWTLPNTDMFSGAFAVDGNNDETGVRLADINGDGLVDYLQSYDDYGGVSVEYVYLNTGSGWVRDQNWDIPSVSPRTRSGFTKWNYYPRDTGTRFFDVNGDGLADLVHYIYYLDSPWVIEESVWINNGHGWTQDTSWDLPAWSTDPALNCFISTDSTYDAGVRFADLNGDGLTDLVRSVGTGSYTSEKDVWINNGHGWTKDTNWTLPTTSIFSGVFAGYGDRANYGAYLVDLNGDGIDDYIQSTYDGNNQIKESVWINNGQRSDLIKHVDTPFGGHVDIAYKPTAQYRDGSNNLLSPNLPFTIDTVHTIGKDDGSGLVTTTAYDYSGGSYFFTSFNDRRFAGFNKVKSTDADGNYTTTFYHQGNSSDSSHGEYQDDGWKISHVYRTEALNSSGNLYAKTINKWDEYDLGNGRKFVKLTLSVESVYDGDSTHKDKAESYVYDNTTGNVTEKVEYGDVAGSDDGTFTDNGTDRFTTNTSYAANTSAHILGLRSQETTVDQSSNKVKESKFYYDTQTLGSVLKGNLTKQEDWKSGSTYANAQKTYDSTYGLVTTSTDARGKVTTYTPDSFNLYPASVTDPLSHATSYLYDYSLGKPKQVTDANNRVFQTVYDGLDRILEEKQPDLATPTTLVTKTAYVYTDTSGAVSVKKSDHLDGSIIADSYTYLDGLGRKIQTRQEAEGSNFAVADFAYNTRDLLEKESLPYFSAGSSKTAATTTAALYTTYAYDPMGRVTTATDANGTTTNTYNDRKLTVTVANSKSKDLIKDAYGNLVEVDEHNGANTYVTAYQYDRLGGLTKITDALTNVRNFTYDGLGRRLTAEDLHAVGDATFGTWSYAYDDVGNMTSKTDPNNQTTNYTYDDINRLLTEDYTGQAGTEVINTYDSGTDGIGRLTSTANAAVSKTLAYNALGMVSSEISTIDTVGYTTTYDYNRQGGQTLVTNPDSSQVKYIFGSAGLLDQVQRKESTDGSFADVVSNFDYSPMGQSTVTTNANGVATTNTYDAAHRYRLATKVTTGNGGTHLQDIAYTYDSVGNVTQLVDASATSMAKTVNYTYDDLYRLLSATATNVASGQTPYTQTYTYDAIGNILTGPAGSYVYAGNQGSSYANPHAVTTVGSDTLSYDNNGNLLTKGSSLSNTWDYNNRLTQAVAGAVTSTYAYDPSGTRVSSSDGTTETYYPTGAYNIAGTTPTKHITANGNTIATVTGTGATASINYINTDHLTGTNIATDTSGVQQEALDYFPYGTIRIDEKVGTFSEQRKYAGHEFDSASWLSYQGARYYDPSIGKFISEDPFMSSVPEQIMTDPQRFNTYSYARNNPINRFDPTGLFDTKTGLIEKGDTPELITNSINQSLGINTTWDTIADVSFFQNNFGTTNPSDLVGKYAFVGTQITADITDVLAELNESRAKTASLLGGAALALFAPRAPWDVKNSNDPILGGGVNDRQYWSYVYNGKLIRYDAPGNINYGYVSRSIGLSSKAVMFGARLAQATDNLSKGNFSWADNSGDVAYVKEGADSYKKTSLVASLWNWFTHK